MQHSVANEFVSRGQVMVTTQHLGQHAHGDSDDGGLH